MKVFVVVVLVAVCIEVTVAGRVGSVNMKTPHCPNGQAYMNECNWCNCKPGGRVKCSSMPCHEWTCNKAFALPVFLDAPCYGDCTCNRITLITTCERFCWPPRLNADRNFD